MAQLTNLSAEIRELRALADKELAHRMADTILCEAFLHVTQNTRDEDAAVDLVDAFKELQKWYA